MKLGTSLGVLAGMLVLAPAFAVAGPTGGQTGPSSGTIIAAAMETAGYVSQAKLLKDLKTMFEGLGGLIYVCVVLTALVTCSLSGKYMTALWLLIGPAMFFFLMRAESSSAGVEWQFGAFNGKSQLRQILKGANVQLANSDRVSNVFHEYNVLISNLYQQLITLLTKDSVRDQMKFMARQKILDELFDTKISDPRLDQLTRFTFTACWQELGAARLVALGQRDEAFRSRPEYGTAVREYCDNYPIRKHNFPNGPAKQLVKFLLNIPPTESPHRLNQVSCQDLFGWMYLAATQQGQTDLNEAIARNIPNGAPAVITNEILRDILDRLTRRSPFGMSVTQTFSCTGATSSSGATATTDGLEGIPIIMASWVLRRGMFGTPVAGQVGGAVFPNAPVESASLGGRVYQSSSQAQGQEVVRRFKSEQLAESAKYEAFMLAKLLPYMQGAGLYILATIYPFFCLLVLLPGHASGFLVWMTLWAWLKSWDVGWALVYVSDALLWDLMPHRSYYRMAQGSGTLGGASVEPVTVLEAAFSGDYSYSLATYWVLVAGMMSAVPIMTAHAVLGAKKAIAGMFVDGAKSIGQVFSKAAGDWVAMEQLGEVDRRIQQRVLFSGAIPGLNQQHRNMVALHQARSAALTRQIDSVRMQLAIAGTIDGLPGGANIRQGINQAAQILQGWAFNATTLAFGGAAPGADTPGGQAARARQQWGNVLASPAELRSTLDRLLAQQSAAQNAYNAMLPAGSDLTIDRSGAAFGRQISSDLQRMITDAANPAGPAGASQRLNDFLSTISNYLENGRQEGESSLAVQLAELTGNNAYRNFDIDNFNHGAPTPELERMAATIHETFMNSQAVAGLGDGMLRARNIAGGVAGVERVFRGLVDAGAAARGVRTPMLIRIFSGTVGGVATPVAFEAQRMYMTTQTLSLEMERGANAATAQYLNRCADHFFYTSARSNPQYQQYELIRAGLTNRAEWWGVPDSPHMLSNQADQQTAILSVLGRGWLSRLEGSVFDSSGRLIVDIGANVLFRTRN